jgi:hypothetical protein
MIQQGTSGDFLWFYEKELAAHDYPPSLIFNETGLTVLRKNNQKSSHSKQTSDWRFNCGIKGFFNNNCFTH